MGFVLPRVYPILDSSILPATNRPEFLSQLASSLLDAGVELLEYRNKTASDAQVLADARILRATLPAGQVKLILDDRVDVAMAAGFDGAHVDAGVLSPEDARRLMGPSAIIGTFGGSESLEPGVLQSTADYLAIGPVFPTTTKETSRNPIGVDGVRRLRAQAGSSTNLVAAAGITLDSAPALLAAGANSLAVAAAIFRAADPAAEFRRWKSLLG